MNDIFEKLKGMDKKELSEAVKQAKAFMKTEEGKALAEKIKSGDGIPKTQHMEIMEEINKNPDIAKTIFNLLKG